MGESPRRMNSRPSSWAPSQFYWRTEQEPNCRKDLEAGKQELGHGKQRRLEAQYLWIFPSQIPFQKAPSQHPAVISKTPACHVITRQLFPKHRCATSSLGYYPQSGQHSPLSLGVTSKTLTSPSSRSTVDSKTPTSCSVARQLTLKL